MKLLHTKYRHLSNLNFVGSNSENKVLDIDILIGEDYYPEVTCDKVATGLSGPVAILTNLEVVLSGRVENEGNQANKHVNVIHFYVMPMQSVSKPELIDTKNFGSNKKADTENCKTDIIKSSVDIIKSSVC